MKDLKDSVKQIIKEYILKDVSFKSTPKIDFYIHKKVINTKCSDSFMASLKSKKSLEKIPQTLVLIDYKPNANWGHKCAYKMFHGETGAYIETISASFPPISFLTNYKDYEPIGALTLSNSIPTAKIEIKASLDKNTTKYGNKYAILFSGISDRRHLNDLEYLYRVLIDVHHFEPQNITVLNYKGTLTTTDHYFFPPPIYTCTWPGNDSLYTIKINKPGTKKDFMDELDFVKNKLKCNDLLFIHTNSHGNGPDKREDINPTYLSCLLPCDSDDASPYHSDDASPCEFTEKEFGKKLCEFPKFNSLIVMMEQCHSGGFSNSIINNSPATKTVFSAACNKWESSHKSKCGNFNAFSYRWIKKMSESSSISINEAFEYAKDSHPKESSNQQDRPVGCAKNITLTPSKVSQNTINSNLLK